MDVELDLTDILDVAGAIEDQWLESYLDLAAQLKNAGLAGTCYRLAAYRRARARRAERARWRAASPGKPRRRFEGQFLCDGPGVLASLAFFARGQRHGQPLRRPTTAEEILQQAGGRSQDALVFYQGLKGFTCDHDAHLALDRLIAWERRYSRALIARLESEGGASGSGLAE